VPVANGSYTLGPGDATLTILTGKGGAASRAGHNLRIEVGEWSATLTVADGDASTLALTANSRSLEVMEGTGGLKALGEDDKASIKQTIDSDVLKGSPIQFRSATVTRSGDGLTVTGELELFGARRPVTFDLTIDGSGRVSGEAAVKHSEFGRKPYSAMLGALKVGDEVRISVDGQLPS
jgi:polyisoprenoid-binding protein YceI